MLGRARTPGDQGIGIDKGTDVGPEHGEVFAQGIVRCEFADSLLTGEGLLGRGGLAEPVGELLFPGGGASRAQEFKEGTLAKEIEIFGIEVVRIEELCAGNPLPCPAVFDAVEAVRTHTEPRGKLVLLTPQGRPMTQQLAAELSREPRLILLAGHYEGFDERIRLALADVEVSIGDFVLSGGEVAAMAVVDAVVRLLPGALGKDESSADESFSHGLLEYPQYTRPRVFRDMPVPDVLLSGDHGEISRWRAEQSRLRTMQRRSDLWERYLRKQQAPESNREPGTDA